MKKGLNSVYGVIAVILAVLSLRYGGYVLIPLFGKIGAFFGGALIALIALVFTLATKTKLKEVFPTELPPIKKFAGALIMHVGVTLVSSGISVITGRFFDANVRNDAIDSMILGMHPVISIVLVAVLPAVFEEFFCRGFLVKCFSGIKREWLVITIVGAVFGALHLDPYTFVPTALTGALLCFVAIRTRSLIIPMILHFGNNALAVALSYVNARQAAAESLDLLSFSLPQSIGMSILYIGLGFFPIFFGYKMFVGKRVFVFKTFVAFMVAVAICVTGLLTFTVFSFRFVSYESERVAISEQAESIPIKIDGAGDFELFLEIDAKGPVEVTVTCDGATVYTAVVNGKATVQKSINYEGVELTVTFAPVDGKKSTVNITYLVLESVIPQ